MVSRHTRLANRLAEKQVCGALWADWWGFKMESFDGIQENFAIVDRPEGGCAIVHSDSEEGIQRLNQEAAKAMTRGAIGGHADSARASDSLDHVESCESARHRRPHRLARKSARWRTSSSGIAIRSASMRWPNRCSSMACCMFDRSQVGKPRSDFMLGQPGGAHHETTIRTTLALAFGMHFAVLCLDSARRCRPAHSLRRSSHAVEARASSRTAMCSCATARSLLLARISRRPLARRSSRRMANRLRRDCLPD